MFRRSLHSALFVIGLVLAALYGAGALGGWALLLGFVLAIASAVVEGRARKRADL